MSNQGLGQIDIYRLEATLGAGGMATVYRAVVIQDRAEIGIKAGDFVAIKVLHPHLARIPEFPRRFAREARVAEKLIHPGVARVFEDGVTDDERPYLVMELAQGHKLGDLLNEGKKFSVEEIQFILRQIAEVLEVARQNGIIHRDIKPDNLIIDEQGRVKVLDFGLVRDQETMSMVSMAISMTGKALGTPAYMSPEQCIGGKEVDHRSDLYSLGVTAYCLATGRTPFVGPTPTAFIHQHQSEIPEPIEKLNPQFPKGLAQVIYRLLAKRVEDRYQTAVELIEDLDRLAKSQGPKIIYKFRKPQVITPKKVALAMAATAAVVLLLVGAWTLYSNDKVRTDLNATGAEAERIAGTGDYNTAIETIKVAIAKYADKPKLIVDIQKLRDRLIGDLRRHEEERRKAYAEAFAEGMKYFGNREFEKAQASFELAYSYTNDLRCLAQINQTKEIIHKMRFDENYTKGIGYYRLIPPDLYKARAAFQAALKEKDDPDCQNLLNKTIATISDYERELNNGKEKLDLGLKEQDKLALLEAQQYLEKAQGFWATPEVGTLIAQASEAASRIRDRLAVVDFQVLGAIERDAGSTVAERLVSRFPSDKYQMVERVQLLKLLDEQKFQMSDLSSKVKANQFGKASKVRYLVCGSINKLGSTGAYAINARILDVWSGQIFSTFQVSAGSYAVLEKRLNLLAQALCSSESERQQLETTLAESERHTRTGKQSLSNQDYDNAISELKNALSLDPENEEAGRFLDTAMQQKQEEDRRREQARLEEQQREEAQRRAQAEENERQQKLLNTKIEISVSRGSADLGGQINSLGAMANANQRKDAWGMMAAMNNFTQTANIDRCVLVDGQTAISWYPNTQARNTVVRVSPGSHTVTVVEMKGGSQGVAGERNVYVNAGETAEVSF